jgi:hypothetical protein
MPYGSEMLMYESHANGAQNFGSQQSHWSQKFGGKTAVSDVMQIWSSDRYPHE